jgi:hypothetical protein
MPSAVLPTGFQLVFWELGPVDIVWPMSTIPVIFIFTHQVFCGRLVSTLVTLTMTMRAMVMIVETRVAQLGRQMSPADRTVVVKDVLSFVAEGNGRTSSPAGVASLGT